MNKLLLGLIGVAGAVVLFLTIFLFIGIGFHNSEVKLRNLITNKETDNKSQMDKMWKNISQTAQVTEEQKRALIEIFNGYATARAGTGDNGSLMRWVQESVPNVDQSIYRNLQNIILAERDGFARRQKEILDFKREHDNLIDTFPNNMFAAVLGRSKINVIIVTSDRTEKAFESGKDNDVNLFNK